VPFRDMALALGAYDKNGNAYLLPDQRLSEAAQNRNLRRVAHTIIYDNYYCHNPKPHL